MNTARHWLHIDIFSRIAHLVSVQVNEAGEPAEARTLTYRGLSEMEDFLAYAIDETHSDASGMLQAVEMQGGDDFWLQLTEEEFVQLPERVSPFRVEPVSTTGAVRAANGLAVATPDGPLVLTPQWAQPIQLWADADSQ